MKIAADPDVEHHNAGDLEEAGLSDFSPIRLFDIEVSMQFMMEKGITTITFFRGDVDKFSKVVEQRVNKIVEMNPWLAGVLVKKRDPATGKKKVFICPMQHQAGRLAITKQGLVKTNVDLDLSSKMSYAEISKRVGQNNQVIVDTGYNILNKNVHFASFCVTKPSSETGEFTFIFSISHVVGDGATYYKILNMVSPEQDIHTLNPNREESLLVEMENGIGKEAHVWQMSGGLLCGILCKGFWDQAVRRLRPKVLSYYVDPDRVERTKAKFRGDSDSFVSTNDILTSFYGNVVNPKIQLMAINFRGRLQGCEHDLAGNYEGGVCLDEDCFATPVGVRRALKEGPPFSSVKNFFGCYGGSCFAGNRATVSMITSWATFPCSFNYDDTSQQVLHLPYYKISDCIFDVAVIYRPQPDKLAVLYFCVYNPGETVLVHESGPHIHPVMNLNESNS